MKKKAFTLFLILLFLSVTFADSISDLVYDMQATGIELLDDWKILSIVIMLFSTLLIAIAYMVGHSFDMPDLKAWAKVEIVQIVASAILLMGFIGFLIFFDGLFMALINDSSSMTGYVCNDIFDPATNHGCSVQIANQYIDGLVELARSSSRGHLQEAYDLSKDMGYRLGYSGHTLIYLPFLWSSMSVALYQDDILHVERLMLVTEYYSPIISSLYAQQFFVKHLSYNVGPYILVLGLLTRSFFATRKLGGLLIAIAVAIMYVFPLMYVFDALTLSVTAFGDQVMGDYQATVCPQECMKILPIGYIQGNPNQVVGSNSEPGVFSWDALNKSLFLLDRHEHPDEDEYGSVSDVLLKGQTAYTSDGTVIEPCGWPTCNPENAQCLNDPSFCSAQEVSDCWNDVAAAKGCPVECRGTPYPEVTQTCSDPDIRAACDALPEVCKRDLVMEVDTLEGIYLEQYNMCPDYCKTIPALAELAGGNCDGEWKAHYYDDDLGCDWDWDDSGGHNKAAATCSNKFDDHFGDAPMVPVIDPYCHNRADGDYWDWDGSGCYEEIDIWCCYEHPEEPCKNADPKCKVQYYTYDMETGQRTLVPVYPDYCSDEEIAKAATCPMPEDINDPNAAYESCMYIVPTDLSNCGKCLFADAPFTYTVPVITDCNVLCGDEIVAPPPISASNFAQMSSEGMYGEEDIKSVSGFMLPAYLLPLFNILVTIMFIKTFSPLLGGDIEIPGLSKVF